MRHLIAIALLCTPAVLLGQSENTISPGMTRAQVEAALGAPATMRTVSEFSYLFYANACGRACGMNDLVILRRDSVVDAIFRSPNRHYTGQSSSPQEARPQVSARRAPSPRAPAVHKEPASATTKPAGTMKPSKEANDIRPSIPVNPPAVKAAPATAPAKTPAKAQAKPGTPQ
ncbi:MAG: hypothetical protein ACJ8AD_10525 [Gemmatimonadaceae bacterium]